VYTQWEKSSGTGLYMARGAALDGSNRFARVQLGHLPANNDYGKEPFLFIAFSLDTDGEIAECRANPESFKPRYKPVIANGKSIEFYVYCHVLQRFSPTNVALEINYVTPKAEDTHAIKEMFFASNSVNLNGFKFPATGFTKAYNDYKEEHNL
jgi:hypothetical protein